MPTILSPFATRQANTNDSDYAGNLIANHFYVDLKAADLAMNNLVDLGTLPAGHTIVGATLIPDDLDTGGSPAITLDVGIMSGVIGDAVSARTVGTELFAASTAAQTGAVAQAAGKSVYTIQAVGFNRSIGVRIAAAPATAAAGRLRLLVLMAPVSSNMVF